MRRLSIDLRGTVLSGAVATFVLVSGGELSQLAAIPAMAAGSCSLGQAALCETFDQPAGDGNRSGQLNGTLWGVSRTTQNSNFGQGAVDAWAPTPLQGCSGTSTVQPDTDVVVCNGQLREAVNDNGSVASLAMYPKQPFDFAGRTGVLAFDVSNDTQGTHAAWPEMWLTDQPVPAPFTHGSGWLSVPRNGFGVRFGGAIAPGQGANVAPGCPNDGNTRWTVDSVVASRNYVVDDQANGGAIHATPLDCVIASTGPNGGLNHVEVHVSQSQIDVYATDAGTTAPLKHIAVVQNANLSLTRGLMWIEDAHYNGNKFNSQGQHTFTWDNVGFDGPVLPRDLAFDVLDALKPLSDGTLNLGWLVQPNVPQALAIGGVTNVGNASGALLTFNLHTESSVPSRFAYTVNGHAYTAAWPYPDNATYVSWRTLALPVNVGDVVAGTNTVTLAGDATLGIANVDLILVAAGGGGSGAGSGNPATATPTATASASATATATATATAARTATPVPPTGTHQYTMAAQANPSVVAPGSTESINVSVTSASTDTALVDVELYSQDGTKVFQQYFNNQSFAAGQTRTYTFSATVASTVVSSGTYTVKVGVFSIGWGALYGWNNSAASFTVQ